MLKYILALDGSEQANSTRIVVVVHLVFIPLDEAGFTPVHALEQYLDARALKVAN
jgi:hypothetical protein